MLRRLLSASPLIMACLLPFMDALAEGGPITPTAFLEADGGSQDTDLEQRGAGPSSMSTSTSAATSTSTSTEGPRQRTQGRLSARGVPLRR